MESAGWGLGGGSTHTHTNSHTHACFPNPSPIRVSVYLGMVYTTHLPSLLSPPSQGVLQQPGRHPAGRLQHRARQAHSHTRGHTECRRRSLWGGKGRVWLRLPSMCRTPPPSPALRIPPHTAAPAPVALAVPRNTPRTLPRTLQPPNPPPIGPAGQWWQPAVRHRPSATAGQAGEGEGGRRRAGGEGRVWALECGALGTRPRTEAVLATPWRQQPTMNMS